MRLRHPYAFCSWRGLVRTLFTDRVASLEHPGVSSVRALSTTSSSRGSERYDDQYLNLCASIHAEGEHKEATKGPHRQAPRECEIKIDLPQGDPGCGYPLPMTSLRKINFKHIVSEALWYLRGEDHIHFLRLHDNPFWDSVADKKLFVGLNYGLLTNYPQEGGEPINQLKEKVIVPLVEGYCSRNMTCTLHKPGQKTKQEACTSTCSFVCRRSDSVEVLDMVLHQRSSDVAVGLVFDLPVWALILHLVCREVGLRSHGKRKLVAGRLTFNLVNAHIYDKNMDEVALVLQREPLPNNCPRFTLGEQAASKSLFAIAEDNESPNWFKLTGYNAHPATHIVPAT